MAETDERSKRANGVAGDDLGRPNEVDGDSGGDGETICAVLSAFVAGVAFPDATTSPPPPLMRRLKASSAKAAPRLREASWNTARDLLLWTRQGSPLRAVLVISCRSPCSFITAPGHRCSAPCPFFETSGGWDNHTSGFNRVAGLHAFLFCSNAECYHHFFARVSGSCWRIFSFSFGLLNRNLYRSIICCLNCNLYHNHFYNHRCHDCYRMGGFFWAVWLAAKKIMQLAKQSLSMRSSKLSAYSAARHAGCDMSSKSAD